MSGSSLSDKKIMLHILEFARALSSWIFFIFKEKIGFQIIGIIKKVVSEAFKIWTVFYIVILT